MRALIIEDEAAAARALARMLKSADREIELQGIVGSISDAVRWLQSHAMPDLILMDIELADGLSFEIARQIDISAFVIFITAYDQYALRAFEVNTIDYLLKPVRQEQLEAALEKMRQRAVQRLDVSMLELLEQTLNRGSPPPALRFLGRLGRKLYSIRAQEIAYFHRDQEVFLCCRDGRQFAMTLSLERLEKRVDQQRFFRLNRRYLVQLHSIRSVRRLPKSRLRVALDPDPGEDPVVSQDRSAAFKAWLGD